MDIMMAEYEAAAIIATGITLFVSLVALALFAWVHFCIYISGGAWWGGLFSILPVLIGIWFAMFMIGASP